jgi:hypothetical protein
MEHVMSRRRNKKKFIFMTLGPNLSFSKQSIHAGTFNQKFGDSIALAASQLTVGQKVVWYEALPNTAFQIRRVA